VLFYYFVVSIVRRDAVMLSNMAVTFVDVVDL